MTDQETKELTTMEKTMLQLLVSDRINEQAEWMRSFGKNAIVEREVEVLNQLLTKLSR